VSVPGAPRRGAGGWRPRLSAVLVLITLVVLALPLGGIAVLRLYESALIRQTEAELIAQGVLIAASYRAQFERLAGGRGSRLGVGPAYGAPVSSPPRPADPENRWRPRLAVLDLATDPVLPPPEDAPPAATVPHPAAAAAGRELTAILRETQKVTLAGIRVTDPDGVIVATTGEELGRSLLHHEEVRRALTGEYVSLMRWRGTTPPAALDSISRGARLRVHVAVPIVHRDRVIGSVLLARTPWNIWQALYGKREALLRGGIVVLAVVLALALLASLLIRRPVQALAEQARRAARGERGAVTPLAHPGTREIAELSETVAAMAQTLEQRANYIRGFAAQVSHEFKTPLSAMQGADIVAPWSRSISTAPERARFLDILEADVKRLGQLVRRLLELARADVMPAGGAAASAGEAVAAVAARFLEAGLAVEHAVGPERVAMAPEVLESVLGNLLDNARAHAGPGARVRISATATAEAVELTVADDGPGISPANAAKVFDPFFTTARERGGTGLGLPIARALVRAHGGELALRPAARGAAFHVRLPRARP
jgi:signal transduction histidine kinase